MPSPSASACRCCSASATWWAWCWGTAPPPKAWTCAKPWRSPIPRRCCRASCWPACAGGRLPACAGRRGAGHRAAGRVAAGEPLPETAAFGWRRSEAGETAFLAMRAGKPRALAALLDVPRSEDWLDDDAAGLAQHDAQPARSRAGRTDRDGTRPATSSTHAGRCSRPYFRPNDEQRAAIDAIRDARGFALQPLLDGVTGSGRPRSTSRRSPTASRAASRRWCWSRRSA